MSKKFLKTLEEQTDGSFIDENGSRFDASGNYISFTKENVKHPGTRRDDESLEEYRDRVDVAVEKGFHLGDLNWSDWTNYCHGSSGWRDADPDPEEEKGLQDYQNSEDNW